MALLFADSVPGFEDKGVRVCLFVCLHVPF